MEQIVFLLCVVGLLVLMAGSYWLGKSTKPTALRFRAWLSRYWNPK